MVKFKLVSIILLLFSTTSWSQDSLYTRKVIKELTSEDYNGRGYVQNGDKKTAEFLRKQFQNFGLKPLGDNYFQDFVFPVNTFPGCMEVKINDQQLVPGQDFIVDPGAPSISGTYKIFILNKTVSNFEGIDFNHSFLVIDTLNNEGSYQSEELVSWMKNPSKGAGIIYLEEKKLTWSVETAQNKIPGLRILRNAFPKNASKITVSICSKFEKAHKTQNVVGYIPGNGMADSLLVVTAHYDHLGRMGSKTYFPGANDNASGISMLLNLAKYYAMPEHRQRYSMVFICFAGEEAGLIGSHFFTEYPLFPLHKIRFLLNLDLLGTGDDGMMVVNGVVYEKEYEVLISLNEKNHYLPSIGKRGKASNSDHYFFTEKGVPAFFCYTTGGIAAYHDIYDKESTLPLTRYKEAFHLFCDFLNQLDDVSQN
ncbi:hypothetical protein BH11BAC2_BH11BAC2_18110 [soil metagenome]